MSVGDASRFIGVALWFGAISTTPIGAQRRDSTARTLPPVTTTATRTDADARLEPRRMVVIDRARIDDTPSLELVDVLKKRAVVDVIQYPGQLSGIGIRGFRPQISGITQRSLILLDGRPSGATNLSLIDPGSIERIEVIKGPAASLYGSNTMGGVVNLISRRRTGTLGGELSLQGASFGTTEAMLHAGGALRAGFDADLSVRRFDQRDDFRIGSGNTLRGWLDSEQSRKTYPSGTRPDRLVFDTVGDGRVRAFTTQQATGGTARIGYALSPSWRIDVAGDGYRGDDIPNPGDISQPFASRKDAERMGGRIELRGQVGRFAPLVRAYRSDERTDSYNRPDSTRYVSFASVTRTDGVQLQSTIDLGSTSIVTGADLSRARAASERFTAAAVRGAPFSPDAEIRSMAGFAEARSRWLGDRVVTTMGARLDRITLDLLATPFRPDVRAGTNSFISFNPTVGVRAALGKGVAAHATAGSAFVAPDPFGRAGLSLQGPTTGANITVGNPSLAPERSQTVDVGVGYTTTAGAFEADVTYFATTVTDRSVSARATFTGATRPRLADGTVVNRVDVRVNAGDASMRGLELTSRFDLLRALGSTRSLALFVNGTRMFHAREAAPAVTLDGSRFANQTSFDPVGVVTAATRGSVTTARIRNVADLTMSTGIEYDDRRRWSFGLLGRYVGRRLDTDFSDFADISDIEYPRYLTVDLTGGVRLSDRVRALVSVANATDENFYEVRGYSLAGRTIAVRLSTRF